MKRMLPLALLTAVAAIAIGATCVIRNEAITKIGDHDTFAGELQNDSGVEILAHKIQVTFLNENNAIVETRTIDGCLRSLQDGQSNFFSVASTLPAAETNIALARMANIIEDPAFKVGTVEQGNITVSDVVVVRAGATLTVSGTVKNIDGDALDNPIACIVLYSTEDRVITTLRVALEDLDIDESDGFSVAIAVPDSASLVEHVDIWVDGIEGTKPTAPTSSKNHTVSTATATATATPTSTATGAPTATPGP